MLAIAVATPPRPSIAADQLSQVPFAIGTNVLFDERRNDGRQGPGGHWTFEDGRLEQGQLRLRLSIEPPPHGLPVESGPAVLFAGMGAFGGSGDVGFTEPMEALAIAVLPACDDADCRYTADVDLSTDEIPGAIRRLEKSGELMWVSAELTLVRTFAGGSWLQVIPLMAGAGGGAEGRAGRLGAITRIDGALFPYGLFPADQATLVPRNGWMFTTRFDYAGTVERLRKRAGDTTAPLAMVPGHLRVEIAPSCESAAHLTLHDDAGDHVFDVEAFGRTKIEDDFEIPVGIPWRLTLHDGGGIDFDQRQGWGVRIGHIQTDGSPVDVDATFDCAKATGTVQVIGGVPDPTTPSPAVAAPQAASSDDALSPDAAPVAPTAGALPASPSGDGEPGQPMAVALALALVGLVGLVAYAGVRALRRGNRSQ